MKKQGNSQVEVCVSNILKTRKGEVFFDRLMGIGNFIDLPLNVAKGVAQVEIEEQIAYYEPRAEIDANEITNAIDLQGNIDVSLIVKNKKVR